MELLTEKDLFHNIAKSTINLVDSRDKVMSIAEYKGQGDYSTSVDVAVETHIVSVINEQFPDDQVLAEENHSDNVIPDSRIWIIDPICGTSNLGKGINNFCTNIALAENKRIIAACVIDHSQSDYLWSIGGNVVYVNDEPVKAPDVNLGVKVDIDFGAVRNAAPELRQKHNRLLLKLIQETNYDIGSLNSSLGFAYSAIGKMDGFINIFNHPWDISAASFLVQQAGGVVTALDGSPWTITSIGAIGGRTPNIHRDLLNLFQEA